MDLISPGLLMQAGGYLLCGGIAFGVLKSRVDDVRERQVQHEENDDRRFNSMDAQFDKVQEKLTTVGEDVAEIKGILRAK